RLRPQRPPRRRGLLGDGRGPRARDAVPPGPGLLPSELLGLPGHGSPPRRLQRPVRPGQDLLSRRLGPIARPEAFRLLGGVIEGMWLLAAAAQAAEEIAPGGAALLVDLADALDQPGGGG